MIPWPKKPFIYQINTWVWLSTLSRDYNWPITLENVPDKILDELASYGVDAIWLMGVWSRSAAAKTSALKYAAQYKSALPDLIYDDIIGSAYAIGAYQVDENLGGRRGLAAFRQRLQQRGLRLVLDFVPNHVALDHAWVRIHPEYLVLGTPRDMEKTPGNFFSARDATGRTIVVAHGRDPYFPGWIDTAQINIFHSGARQALLATLLDIASQCDGVRCDMAMLLVNDVFAHTWQNYVGAPPAAEFWPEIIPPVRLHYPHFAFIAEVYWDMEARLLELGFDYTYDKRLYDRLVGRRAREVRDHLQAALNFQERQVRFIENHDEQRAAETLGPRASQPAAVLVCTLPGAVLLHDGQLSGRRVKLPVQIGRQPYEPPNEDLKHFYLKLLAETRAPIYQTGDWRLFPVEPVAKDNLTHDNLIAYGWRRGADYRLIIVNLTDRQSQALVNLETWPEVKQRSWALNDVLNGHQYLRQGDLVGGKGLYVDLWPFGAHIFHLDPA